MLVVLLVLAVGLGVTLGKIPYPRSNDLPIRVVFVVGKQFSWGISDQPISNADEYEAATSSNPMQLQRIALQLHRIR